MQPPHQSDALLSLCNTCQGTPEMERQTDTSTAQSLENTQAQVKQTYFPDVSRKQCVEHIPIFEKKYLHR